MAERIPLTVAVFNASDDVVELLRLVFEQQGCVVVSAHLDDIKRAEVDLEQLIRQHRPRVILYDVSPPYDRQWTFMNHMRALPVLQEIPFVLTSTNAAKVKEIVGTDVQVHEIVGKPYDLEEIRNAVMAAARARES